MSENTERDELTQQERLEALIIEGAQEQGFWVGGLSAEAIAASILAAGYRRPRTITTVEELNALPVGAVLILRDAKHEPHPAQKGEYGWRVPFVDRYFTSDEILSGCESIEATL